MPDEVLRYLIPRWYRWGVWLFITVLWLLATVLLVLSLLDPVRFSPWLAVGLAAIWCWNAYWFLARTAVGLTFDGTTVAWRSPIRRGSFAVDELVEIRPMQGQVAAIIIVCALSDGSKLLVQNYKGFGGPRSTESARTPSSSGSPGGEDEARLLPGASPPDTCLHTRGGGQCQRMNRSSKRPLPRLFDSGIRA